jgi:hypothetical protein
MKTTILARYTSYEELFMRRSTPGELIQSISKYSRESVIYACASAALLLKIWSRAAFDIRQHDQLVASFFQPVMASSLIAISRLDKPQYVFHRRQFLLLIKLALMHCPEQGIDLVKEPLGFGEVLLMANDQFHFELGGTTNEEKLLNTLTNFVPVVEYSGLRLQNEIARSYLMLTQISLELTDHPDFIDIPDTFYNLSRIPLHDYLALWFGLISKYMSIDLQSLQKDWTELYIRPEFFRTTQIPLEIVQIFLAEMTATPGELRGTFMRRDYGSNDFTALRSKPLIVERNGAVLSDIFFAIEKIQSGPYWRINDSSRAVGDRLRRLWGSVFEEYLRKLFTSSCDSHFNYYFHDPRYQGSASEQVCDAFLIFGDTLILLEYKSSMFRAESKYSGNPDLLLREIEDKLVVTREDNPKGVKQLAAAVRRLFGTNNRERVQGVDLSHISQVFPVLITLDSIGRTLLMPRFLSEYFQREVQNHLSKSPQVSPLFSVYVEDLEMMSGFFKELPFAQILSNWIEHDPKLVSTLLAIENPALAKLGPRHNQMLDQTFDEYYLRVTQRLGLVDPPDLQ